MATPSSGEFKLQDIVTEFGGDAPHGLTEYYAGGSNVGSGTQNAQGQAVPSSGEIKLTDFYGTSNTFAMRIISSLLVAVAVVSPSVEEEVVAGMRVGTAQITPGGSALQITVGGGGGSGGNSL